jgi:glycosyltransferase involved in cell wall biosynthesis
VLPTFNRAATLPRAIDSVLAQTWTDWELIVVDDGSSDGTTELLAGYDDPRIRSVCHETNRGVTAAKNTGFDQILGDWLVMLDSDDEMVPEALESLATVAATTGAEAITCNCRDSRTGEMTGHGWDADGWKAPADLTRIRGEHWGMTKTSLLGSQRFDERIPGFEGILWLKITYAAGRRYYTHKALRIYHKEGQDRVSTTSRSRLQELAIYRYIGEDEEYLRALHAINPERYKRVMRKVRQGRLLARLGRARSV